MNRTHGGYIIYASALSKLFFISDDSLTGQPAVKSAAVGDETIALVKGAGAQILLEGVQRDRIEAASGRRSNVCTSTISDAL